MAQQKTGCTIKTIGETSCDFEYKFKDYSGNIYHYKVDFMLPVDFNTTTDMYDATVVVAIQYHITSISK